MKKLYALTMLFSVASLQASDPLAALVQTIKAKTAWVLNKHYGHWDRKTVLHFAGEKFHCVLTLLIQAGCNVHVRDAYDRTPFNCAQYLASIGALIAAGAFNEPSTPLHEASDHLDALLQRLGEGLALAIKSKNLDQVKAAIKKAKAADVLNKPCMHLEGTALHLAAKEFSRAVPLLIKAGCNVHAKDIHGHTPLHFAQSLAAIKALVDAGASVNAATHYGRTPLHNASNDSVAETLLKLGANPKAKETDQTTPLHFARTAKIALLLINNGVDPKATSIFGRTPLHFAVSQLHLDVVALLAPLSDLEKRCSNGYTALHKAACCYHNSQYDLGPTQQAIVGILLNAGADINAREKTGNTLLHLAAQSDNVGVARFLLRYTGKPNPCKQTEAPEEEEKE